jgi:hypothetical protein
MDSFIQKLLRGKLLSVEGNDINDVVDIICPLPVSSDDDIISISVNAIKEKLSIATIAAPNNADIGTGRASTSLMHRHRPHRFLYVDIVTDNALVFADARPNIFRQMEDKKTQIIDRWDAIYGSHSSNNISNNNKKNNNCNNDINDLLRRKMSDSRLVIPDRRWKQQHRDFRRENCDSMLLIPTRRCSVLMKALAIKEDEDEGHTDVSNNDLRPETSDSKLAIPKTRRKNRSLFLIEK